MPYNDLRRFVYRHIDDLWIGLLDKNGRPIHGDRHVIIRLQVSGIVGFFSKRLDGIKNVTFLHGDRVLEFRPPVFIILQQFKHIGERQQCLDIVVQRHQSLVVLIGGAPVGFQPFKRCCDLVRHRCSGKHMTEQGIRV